MAVKDDAQERIVASLASSSPLLSEVAALLAQTSATALGLPTTDAARAKFAASSIRSEGISVADQVSTHAAVVSQAAPDLALAAPDFAVAANA